MSDRLLADTVVVAHLLFIAFAVAGGALVLWRPRFAWLHLPAVAWAVYVELSGTICPLTPLENELRRRAGATGYSGGFVEHYVIPVIYPPGLTPAVQLAIAAALIAINFALYVAIWRRWRNRSRGPRGVSSR